MRARNGHVPSVPHPAFRARRLSRDVTERLPAHLEVSGLLRAAESCGGFGTVLKRGDPDRGTIHVLVLERGVPAMTVERRLTSDFTYRWSADRIDLSDERIRPDDERRIDPDRWSIELDIPDAERFVAEMTELG